MTEQEAKDITTEVWNCLATHPEIFEKDDIPPEIWNKICHLPGSCPLCELFSGSYPVNTCSGCPLHEAGENCNTDGSAWRLWRNSEFADWGAREKAAYIIISIVNAWEPKEED
jgi:hypothetical protein